MAAYDIVALGTPVIDVFAKCDDAFLKKHSLTKGSTNFLSREGISSLERGLGKKVFLRYPGDNARNVCETLARLGGRAAFAGRVGPDSDGEMFERSLTDHGAFAALDKKARNTGKIICLITGEAERTFAADLGDSENFVFDKLFGYEGSKFVFASSITLLSKNPIGPGAHKLLLRARARNMKSVLALESPSMIHAHKLEVNELMREADFVFMNENERHALGVGEHFLTHLGSTVFLKRGAQGATIYEHGKKPLHVPALKVKKVVDTTGAGDAFAAGTIYGLSQGRDVLEAAKIGAKCGAATVSLFGSSMPHDFSL